MIDPTYQRFSLFLFFFPSTTPTHTHTHIHTPTCALHSALICNVPFPSHTRIKPHRSLPISLSGNHFTRGNPKHGCGGISLWYVLAFIRTELVKCQDASPLFSIGGIAKVGVASVRCVCIAILYSDHCRHLIYFREKYIYHPLLLSLCYYYFSSPSSSSLSLFIYHTFLSSHCLTCSPSIYFTCTQDDLLPARHGSNVHDSYERLLRLANCFPKCSRVAILFIR